MDVEKMINDLLKGKIDRREFLKAGGIAAFLYMVGIPVLNKGQSYISKVIKDTSSSVADDYEKDLIFKIFSNLQQEAKFIPGTSHHLFPGEMHPNDQKAGATLANVALMGIPDLKVVDNFITLYDLEGTLIASGSPVSNFLSRAAMAYQYADKDPSKGLRRNEKNSFFDLPFEFVIDVEALNKAEVTVSQIIKGSILKVPNWSLYSNIEEKLMVPVVSEEGQLKTDYLLVTVLPNYFSKSSYDAGHKLIIFAGTHGVGTKAIELLFRNEQVLQKLWNKVHGTDYWQAVIEIDQVSPRVGEVKRAEPFSISDEIFCAPIHYRKSMLEAKFKV